MKGLTTSDSPAPPLSLPYARTKGLKHPPAIRNLSYMGATLSRMAVTAAGPNTATIGFMPGVMPGRKLSAEGIIAVNKRRAVQFGVSQRDRQELMRLSAKYPKVVIERED